MIKELPPGIVLEQVPHVDSGAYSPVVRIGRRIYCPACGQLETYRYGEFLMAWPHSRFDHDLMRMTTCSMEGTYKISK